MSGEYVVAPSAAQVGQPFLCAWQWGPYVPVAELDRQAVNREGERKTFKLVREVKEVMLFIKV